MGGGEKNFSAARGKQNPEKKYCRPIFFWKISGGARQKRNKARAKRERRKKLRNGIFCLLIFQILELLRHSKKFG